MKRSRHHLTPTQWVLIQHVVGQALCLALSLVFGLELWSLALSVVITLTTVARLVKHRTFGVVLTRSIEPLLIVVVTAGWLSFIQLTVDVSPMARSLILIGALFWQARFLLLQFDPDYTPQQSGHSLLLVVLMQSLTSLWLITSPSSLPWILVLTWLAQYCTAHFWLERIGFHNSFVAAAWALVASELVLLSSFTIIIYKIPLTPLFISRTSLVTAGLAYSWGSLLKLHSQRRLTKELVLEYGFVCVLSFGLLYFMPAV